MKRIILAACMLGAAGAPAVAQDHALGAREYMVACAGCHGETGLGDGPIAGLLDIETPNLTTLAARADGVFPYASTLRMIDGRNEVRAHGSEMPVWGDRFFVGAATSDGLDPGQSDLIAKGRILALVGYLESIQAN